MYESIAIFSRFLFRELGSPINYITALLIGAVINVFQGGGPFHSLAPFIVPIIVQAVSKASVNYKHKDADILLRLPAERPDPAFVINFDGLVVACAGKCKALLKKMEITRLDDIFTEEDSANIISALTQTCDNHAKPEISELYSETFKKWFSVSAKCEHDLQLLLVWLQDITPLKELDSQLLSIRSFSNEIIGSIRELSKENNIYDRLAGLILNKGYRGVFITRKSQDGYFSGCVYKYKNGELDKTYTIKISQNSLAPILDSHRSERIVSVSKGQNENQAEFDKAHPFDGRVRGFLDFPIENYVNYHEGDVAIIAFNKATAIHKYDLSAMETLVNSARASTFLIDLAIGNDEKFLQIITGLSAASEYSDELTGKHILRVNEYSRLLAENLGCDEEFSDYIHKVAALHDIGKVAIPEIIKLERKLTDDELKEMRMHTIYGAKIIDEMISLSNQVEPRLVMARNIALCHHQQWNGNGYPAIKDRNQDLVALTNRNHIDYTGYTPLKGDEIPLEALITSLADKYDALRSARQYKPAFSHEKTTAILIKDDRTGVVATDVFGPRIAELYLDIQGQLNDIFEGMQES